MPELPLTPVEIYFFHDHRESHPAWIRYDFTFRGVLERAALARALERIPKRHPLTGATVVMRRWRKPVWKLDSSTPKLIWRDASTPEVGDDDDVHEHHDLSTRAGLICAVRVRGEQTHLILDAHHAVADGLGGQLIANDLLVLYANECGTAIPLPEIASLNEERKRRSEGPAAPWRQLPWIALGVAWGSLLDRQLVVQMRGIPEGGHCRRLAASCLPADDVVKLRKIARTAGASLNELLLRDLQTALGTWLQRHDEVPPEAWTRILVPVNVGGDRVSLQNSANALGVALIDRRVKSLGRRARLLQRAHEDMEYIRRRGLMRAFGALMRLRDWLPGGIARYCRRRGSRSTLVFSNIGKLFAGSALMQADGVLTLPGAELMNCSVWGPCRPGTNMFVVTGSYRGTQRFWISYDPASMSTAQAEDFATELKAQMRRSLAGE